MVVLRFEDAPQGALGVMEPRPHGPDGTANYLRDRLIGHLLEKLEHQHLTVLGSKAVERGVDAAGVLGREFVVVLVGDVDLLGELGWRPTPAELAERPAPRDPIEPCGERSGLGQPRQTPEDVAPDLLQDVLDVSRRPEDFPEEVAEPRSVGPDDLAERRLVADLATEDEQPFVELAGGVGH
jgi:hypothetical protein